MSRKNVLMCAVKILVVIIEIILNFSVLVLGHNVGIYLSEVLDIDPNMALCVMSAGFANNIMIIILFIFIVVQILLSEKIIRIIDKLDILLSKKLKC